MWLDILLIVIIAGALFLALRKLIRDRRRGKCTCGCDGCDRCTRRPE